jgi:hypothetical protein
MLWAGIRYTHKDTPEYGADGGIKEVKYPYRESIF